ncbi:hypothetical protein HYC85_016464 [Camellia sinensis]|uniref:Major facilitator superfamily (MFS) profile domain-containing protein n=1 Tax=Camellia sinensis TaxID=4442 RepID=A0A7J7H3G9_CAMSI|nr:hypothetical protein HYC85_016464 [Camellia sinensis]
MSIAILPMSQEFNWNSATVGLIQSSFFFNWNSATVGLIQSSFFWGYLLTQIVGGIWADKVGGKLVLGFGVIWWSVATILIPIAARVGLPFLLTMRAFMGIGEVGLFLCYLVVLFVTDRTMMPEAASLSAKCQIQPPIQKLGVAMPAMNNILSKWIPVPERSRSLALVYSGMYLGSVTGLAFSPILIHNFGWSSVFYSFGSLEVPGLHYGYLKVPILEDKFLLHIWLFASFKHHDFFLDPNLGINYVDPFPLLAHSSPNEDPELRAEEKRLILGGSNSKEPVTVIPWKLILSKAPVWALIISHFCHNWGTSILLTWMPTYYNQVLKFNLTESGLLCVLPWLTMAVFANIGGWIADTLVSKGLSVTTVLYKQQSNLYVRLFQGQWEVLVIMQSIGFLGPAFFLTQLSHVKTPALAVLCMACSQGSDAFSQSGLYSNHQDIGPRYAGVLLGLSNTAGVLAGVFGTAATGYVLQKGSWDDVCKVSVALYIIGTIVWNIFSTGEKILE